MQTDKPLYADRSVKLEEDVVSCSRSDGPEEVLSQVRLLECVTLIHLRDTTHTFSSDSSSHGGCRRDTFVVRHLHGCGDLSWGVDVHLVEQRLQEVFVLQDTHRQEATVSTQEADSTAAVGKRCERDTHCEFLDLSSQRRMKSDMLEQGRSEAHAKAGLLPLAVFL